MIAPARNVAARVIGAALLTLTLFASPARAQEVLDPVATLAGVWQVVDGRTGEVAASCEGGQQFAPSEDRRTVVLHFLDAPEHPPTVYEVQATAPGLARMAIRGEERMTADGRPVVWVAVFFGPDEFRWHRTDWPGAAVTDAIWRRCAVAVS
jgi:hypothetical protein